MFDDLSGFEFFWQSGDYKLCRSRSQCDAGTEDLIIYDAKNRYLVNVEDNDLSAALKKRMKLEGVQILDRLPAEQNILERVKADLLTAGFIAREFNEAFSVLKEMKEQRKKDKDILLQLELLVANKRRGI